ncbi:MAG: ATP-binding protein, partial [Actinomycetia bacterium]|nr:ATP-binding protein [Actinomycetes bacterium]
DVTPGYLFDEVRALFEQHTASRRRFDPQWYPELAKAATAMLDPKAAPISEPDVREVVQAAITVTRGLDQDGSRPLDDPAALAGAAAFFYFVPYHDTSADHAEITGQVEIATGSTEKRTTAGAHEQQPYRQIWARLCADRVRFPDDDKIKTVVPRQARKKDTLDGYATALATAVADAVRLSPDKVRDALALSATAEPGPDPFAKWRQLSDHHIRELAVEPRLYVPRGLEAAVLDLIVAGTDHRPQLVVGEAGHGKSTLLWSICQQLEHDTKMVPLLLPASTLVLKPDLADLRQALAEGAEQARGQGRRPVVLIDTVDLLAHGEAAVRELLLVMDALHRADVTAVYSTRPQEASLIINTAAQTQLAIKQHEIRAYDDGELDQAVEKLAEVYCPAADAERLRRWVKTAMARGLPVAEVCRSPLLLRMLFDLSAPDEPELGDLDVSSLFETYWARRVQRDVHNETQAGQRPAKAKNLAGTAGDAGIALLVAGTPEIAKAGWDSWLGQAVRACGHDADPARLTEDVAVLTERGVLTDRGGWIGFFHQSLFEFAAAKGLLAVANPKAIEGLTGRVIGGSGDLFVGAVLEQLLILASVGPFAAAVWEAVQRLLRADNKAVRAIGLAVWAHHPQLSGAGHIEVPPPDVNAVRRAAQIIVTSAGREPAEAIDLLEVLWWMAPDLPVGLPVVHALTRLARRAPQEVAEACERFQVVEWTVAHAYVGQVLGDVLQLVGEFAAAAPDIARATYLRLLETDSPNTVMYSLTDHWELIARDGLLDEIEAILAKAENFGMVYATSHLRAFRWRVSHDWWDDPDRWGEFVKEAARPAADKLRYQVEIDLDAIASYVRRLDGADPRVRKTIKAMLACTGPARDLVGSEFFYWMFNPVGPCTEVAETEFHDLF